MIVLGQFIALAALAFCIVYGLMQLEPMDIEEAKELWDEFYRDVGEMFFAPAPRDEE